MSIYENKKLSVYLAGGMRGDWQERVIESAGHDSFNFINPKKNGSKVFEEFTFWDVLGVNQCDIVFAYLEKSNPAGHAMMVEAGIAIGKGKFVIFVNEQHDNKYTMFLAHCPNVIFFDGFDKGVNYLARNIGNLYDGYSQVRGY